MPNLNWRPEVVAFANAMEEKLRANDKHKIGWKNSSSSHLLKLLRLEVLELEEAIQDSINPLAIHRLPKEVLEEAADVANFCLFIADVCGTLDSSFKGLDCDHCGDVAIWADPDGLYTDGDGGKCLFCGFPGQVSCDSETPAYWMLHDWEETSRCNLSSCEECTTMPKLPKPHCCGPTC